MRLRYYYFWNRHHHYQQQLSLFIDNKHAKYLAQEIEGLFTDHRLTGAHHDDDDDLCTVRVDMDSSRGVVCE